MTVLITGGAGFIGRPLARRFAESGERVVVTDRVERPDGLHDDVDYRVLDVTDGAAVRSLVADVRPEIVVHTAAVVGVAASVGSGLLPTVDVNIAGSVTLFEALIATGATRRLVDLSSEEYYGDFASDPLPEDAPAMPVSPYGISKFAVERLGRFLARTAGLAYVAARLSWVYGPDFPRTRIPEPWFHDVVEGRPTLLERGGDHRIDFTHVDDVIDGLELLARADSLDHEAYNLATGRAVTVRELAAALSSLRPDWDVSIGGGPLELAPGVVAARKGAYDISRARDELGYSPKVPIEQGLADTLSHVERRLDRKDLR
jgi:nucleoside-diphosphate-sugar epimerase